jgi:hypothetical protein
MRPLLFCVVSLVAALLAHQQAQQALDGPPMPKYTLEAQQWNR